jgi:hypothetical protein
MLSRAIAVAAVLALPPVAAAQEPTDTQGLIRERDAQTEQLRQEDKARASRALRDRQQQENAARQRLESGRIERMQAPTLLQGAPPNLSGGATLPGYTDRAGEMTRDDAARRDRLDHDSAARARDDAARAARDATGRAAPWKPIGAR